MTGTDRDFLSVQKRIAVALEQIADYLRTTPPSIDDFAPADREICEAVMFANRLRKNLRDAIDNSSPRGQW